MGDPTAISTTNIRKSVRYLAGLFTILIWIAYMVWRYPEINSSSGPLLYRASPLVSFFMAVVPAYAFALLSVLFSNNRYRLLAVLRPNFGRIFSALLLAGITPVHIFDWLPFIPFGLIPLIISFDVRISSEQLWFFGLCTFFVASWYPVASLLISGISSRWWRFGGFCLMFWATYVLSILLFGVRHLSL